MDRLNKTMIIKILLILTGLISVFLIGRKDYRSIKKQNEILMYEFVKQLSKKEAETKRQILGIENKISRISKLDNLTQEKILLTEKKYKTILQNLKTTDYEKIKTDNEIINDSYNADHIWFQNRFSKYPHNNGIPVETDTITGEQRKN